MLTFRLPYFLLALLLFVVEVLIAMFVHDRFVRPFGGDYLVVMLIYCTLRAFIKAGPVPLAIATLLFACGIEVLQLFHIADRLGLARHSVARVVIGNGFDWLDLLAYTLGVGTVLLVEWRRRRT